VWAGIVGHMPRQANRIPVPEINQNFRKMHRRRCWMLLQLKEMTHV
jgi:hypothetical protein